VIIYTLNRHNTVDTTQ